MSRYRETGAELLQQAITAELEVVKSEVMELGENVAERIELRIDEDDLETSSFGLLFALGVLSFGEARPRGISGMHYQEDDEFGLEDLLMNLRFERGCLTLTTDYLRGRMMKTDVTIHPDGRVEIVTRNRGEAASRWVMRLQGKKVLREVTGDSEEGGPTVNG